MRDGMEEDNIVVPNGVQVELWYNVRLMVYIAVPYQPNFGLGKDEFQSEASPNIDRFRS